MRLRLLLLSAFLTATASAEPVRVRIEQYSADSQLLSRHTEIAGDSPFVLERRKKMLEGWLSRVRGLEFASLASEDQVDGVLLSNELEASLQQLDEQLKERRELEAWLPSLAAVPRNIRRAPRPVLTPTIRCL